MYGDPFHLFLVFSHYSSHLKMHSHDLCMPSQPWKLLLWIHLINWPFWLQMLQLNTQQQSVLFENLTSLPFCSTFIQTVTKHNLQCIDTCIIQCLLLLILQSLIGWQFSIWNCCKPFFSLLYNYQLLCFWRLALSIVVKVFLLSFFWILLLQGCLLQTVMPNYIPYP